MLEMYSTAGRRRSRLRAELLQTISLADVVITRMRDVGNMVAYSETYLEIC
jgi:hypothetical protein